MTSRGTLGRWRSVRLAVCQAPAEMLPDDAGWRSLAARVRRRRPDVLVLNEMPFGRWIASGAARDHRALVESQRLHQRGLELLGDLGVPVVIGTRPALHDGCSVNQGFVWTAGRGLQAVHTKQFFPDEEGYYEARWFEPGEPKFRVVDVRGLRIGFLICTDVWFSEWARRYGRLGAHLIVVPRATPRPSLASWKTGVATAAIVSGCYVASSNRAGRDSRGQVFGGRGWIFDSSGKLLAETSAGRPVAGAVIDPAVADAAKQEYPRYVEDVWRRNP